MKLAKFLEEKVMDRVEKLSIRVRAIAFLLDLAVMAPVLAFFLNQRGQSVLGWIAGMIGIPFGWAAWILLLSFIPEGVFSSNPMYENQFGMKASLGVKRKKQYIRGKIVLVLTALCIVILAAGIMWSIVLV